MIFFIIIAEYDSVKQSSYAITFEPLDKAVRGSYTMYIVESSTIYIGGEAMDLDSTILRHIGALSRSIHSINDIRFKSFHLQRSQFIFVTRICENPGLNQMALTHMLKVDKATTTKAVQKLIAEGYVIKERDSEDRRAWLLYPTKQARQVYPHIIAAENKDIATCFSGFTAEEQALICRLIGKMNANVEEEWKQYKNY